MIRMALVVLCLSLTACSVNIDDLSNAQDAASNATPQDASITASLDATTTASLDASITASLDASITASLDASIAASLDASTASSVDAAPLAELDAATPAGLDATIMAGLDAATAAGLDASAAAGLDAASTIPLGTGLYTQGNHLYAPNGKIWHGRGANVMDTRSCNACTWAPPVVSEVNRRIDELVDNWKANFIRLALESYGSADGRDSSNYQSALQDSQYLADIRSIVQHIGTKPGVNVLVSVWVDPSIDANGWPTVGSSTTTDAEWQKLVSALYDQPQVIFGIINEPQGNYDGSQDKQVWDRMSAVVKAIRDAEDVAQVPYHVITVQGTGGWARRLDYYVTHPITERGGQNVAYEVHVYNATADFPTLFENAAKTLPVVIGEFGPDGTYMQLPDCTNMMDVAQQMEIPHLAWTFHMRCDPNLLVDNSGGGCGVGMSLQPTAWGSLIKTRYAQPW
jgi:hypothetical protein